MECPLCEHENNDECGCWEIVAEYPADGMDELLEYLLTGGEVQ